MANTTCVFETIPHFIHSELYFLIQNSQTSYVIMAESKSTKLKQCCLSAVWERHASLIAYLFS